MAETPGFLGYESVPLEAALFSVIPAPYEATSTYIGGQGNAPDAIFDASFHVEEHDEELGVSVIEKGVHYLPLDQAPRDEGVEGWVKANVINALDKVAVPVVIGGEGTVTLWAAGALVERTDELSLLHIDAHADLAEAETESHRTVMRRILDLTPRPHVCQVGVRSLSSQELNRIVDQDGPLGCWFMSDINLADDELWHEDVIEELRSPVYVSIDLSAFDPSVVPAVSNPEPGGLYWWPMLRLLKKVANRRRIAGFDIVELCPREGDVVSDFTAARLVYKLMSYIYTSNKMLPKPEMPEEEEDATE